MNIKDILSVCSSVIDCNIDEDLPLRGVDYRLGRVSAEMFYLIMDDNWQLRTRKKYGQYDIAVEELVAQAKNRGVSKFIIPEYLVKHGMFEGCEHIVVSSTYRFFYEIAAASRNASKAKLIAITGSAGKSTTKDMISLLLLKGGGSVFIPRPSENIRPNILSHLTKLDSYECAVLEVAGSCFQKFEKDDFSISPDVAVVTAISEGHLEYLGTLKGVAEHKAKIFSGMNKNHYSVINLDTEYSDLLVERAKSTGAVVVGYGSEDGADVQLIDYDYLTGLVTADIFNERISYNLNARGHHMALNSLAAITAVRLSGIEDWKARLQYFSDFSALSGRGETFKISLKNKSFTIIDEAYNANPASMSSALQLLSEVLPNNKGRRIAVLGDMMELGSESKAIHAKLINALMLSKPDKVYLVGEFMEQLWIQLPTELKGALFPTVNGLYRFLKPELKDGDVVLFKSSNSVGLSSVVNKMKSSVNKG